MSRRKRSLTLWVLLALVLVPATSLQAAVPLADQKPNILAIWGDDIGWFNLSIHNHGIMGYQTPNLDRIGKEGAMFTDAYAEQSCTAGRAAFLTGQHGLRSGMLKVGLPGVAFGMEQEDPTVATMLKEYGYLTGQFGKNHLGDTNAYLPTNRGFDEFFGNLYHLNAEGEPEHPDYPGDLVIIQDDPDTPNIDEEKTFEELFGPRGVIHSFGPSNLPSSGSYPGYDAKNLFTDIGGTGDQQYIEDTGSLTRHRMKTIDGAFAKEAIRFMNEAVSTDDGAGNPTPFFVWYAASRMHVWTYLREDPAGDTSYDFTEIPAIDYDCHTLTLKYGGTDWPTGLTPIGPGAQAAPVCNLSIGDDAPNTINGYFGHGVTGYGLHPDAMVEHDMYVGQLLDYLDHTFDSDGATPLANNTLVFYTSDNGAETFSWPDGGTTPFRSEKATNWEGGYRVPLLVRWPAKITVPFVSNDIVALQDWFPTLATMATTAGGGPGVDVKDKLLGNASPNYTSGTDGLSLNGTVYRVHLDGYDLYDYFVCAGDGTIEAGCESPRKEFIYANDDGVIVGIRYNHWKVVFQEQRAHGVEVWENPFTYLRKPKIFNLRSDPFETADHEATQYGIWNFDHAFLLTPAQTSIYKWLQTFAEFPPRQVPPSFGINFDAQDIVDECGDAAAPSGACFGSDSPGVFDFPAVGGG